MTTLELSDEEAAPLATAVKHTISADRYPLQHILDRLEPPRERPAASPEPRVYARPSRGRYRTRR